MEFTQANFRQFNKEAEAALAALAVKYNLTLEIGGGSYSYEQFTTKITCNKKRRDGLSPEQHNFNQCARSHGLQKSDFGRVVLSKGVSFKVIGIKPRSRTYPILMENLSNGKKVKFRASYAQSLLQSVIPAPKVVVPARPATPSTYTPGNSLPANVRDMNRTEQVKWCLTQGITSVDAISTTLGLNKSYANRILAKI